MDFGSVIRAFGVLLQLTVHLVQLLEQRFHGGVFLLQRRLHLRLLILGYAKRFDVEADHVAVHAKPGAMHVRWRSSRVDSLRVGHYAA